MFYSGVLVTANPGELEKAVQSVEGKGLEIYHRDPDAERFIAVIEGETIQSEADLFKDLITLPGIQNVSLSRTWKIRKKNSSNLQSSI